MYARVSTPFLALNRALILCLAVVYHPVRRHGTFSSMVPTLLPVMQWSTCIHNYTYYSRATPETNPTHRTLLVQDFIIIGVIE